MARTMEVKWSTYEKKRLRWIKMEVSLKTKV